MKESKNRTMKTKNGKLNNDRALAPSRVKTNRIADATRPSTPAISFRIQSILVPIDFSEASKRTLKYALTFAEKFGAKLTLLYVVAPVATSDFAYYPFMMEDEKITAAGYEELKKLHINEKIDPQFIEKTLVRKGVAYWEITEAAKSLKADLIVISTHGNTGLKHLMLGSTAERVVRHAECPVLVVRERENGCANL
jgi:nucleotide-binding universal stress UspA family protein